MFSLPDRLTKLGMTGIEDVEMHQMKYRGALLGEALGEGLLTKPAEQPPPPNDDGEPAEGTNDEELPEEERRARCEKFGLSVRFKGSERIVRYRGSAFVRDFQNMLSHAGGVWFFYKPEEKPSTDPKKTKSSRDCSACCSLHGQGLGRPAILNVARTEVC